MEDCSTDKRLQQETLCHRQWTDQYVERPETLIAWVIGSGAHYNFSAPKSGEMPDDPRYCSYYSPFAVMTRILPPPLRLLPRPVRLLRPPRHATDGRGHSYSAKISEKNQGRRGPGKWAPEQLSVALLSRTTVFLQRYSLLRTYCYSLGK